jgi:hypothetical protein
MRVAGECSACCADGKLAEAIFRQRALRPPGVRRRGWPDIRIAPDGWTWRKIRTETETPS